MMISLHSIKPDSKSAFFRILAIAFCMACLAGCADAKWPAWLTGEPDPSVLNKSRPVMVAPSVKEQPWPNLASVPERPTDFTPKKESTATIDAMVRDHDDALHDKAAVEAQPKLEPAPLPPPSVIGADDEQEN